MGPRHISDLSIISIKPTRQPKKTGCSGIPVRCVPARYYSDVKDSIQTSNYLLAHDNEHFEISAWIKFSLEECHAITSKL